ncbi:MAG: sulfate ABC transporter substrate-binding protein [Chloroflexi bacterium]|nr:sulfate ABC transporter substrate-binding protein [Chloroflexota bacterium]NOG62184.1 sulfate ABC transporter substrate-binding protein [Chloroflexota bacterium]
MKTPKTLLILALLLSLIAFGVPTQAQDQPETVTITLAAYAVPREAYEDVIPAFQAYWQEKTGQAVIVQESYQASGAQSRAVAGGFEADIVALSVESDVTRLVDAGLITHDWKANYNGFVTNSVVVLATREGNPLEIEDWGDLAGDVEVITPDPATSGGAQWNILAVYGAARRGFVEGYAADDEGATEFLTKLLKNVVVFDRDGRESILTFEYGIGDVAITYENEIYAGEAAGSTYSVVYPTSTILIENPIAVVDAYVDEHGTREVAEAFVAFAQSAEAQRIFVENGFRPVNEDVIAEVATDEELAEKFPKIEDLFTIEEFGGWSVVRKELFGDEGRFTALIAEVAGE